MKYAYDVVLSFADEDSEKAQALARHLMENGIHCYFYEYNRNEIAGRNLHKELGRLYGYEARLAVVLLSEAYFRKKWTHTELEHILRRNSIYGDYLLPVKTDSVSIPRTENFSEDYVYYQWDTQVFDLVKDISMRIRQYREKLGQNNRKKTDENESSVPANITLHGDGSIGTAGTVKQIWHKK